MKYDFPGVLELGLTLYNQGTRVRGYEGTRVRGYEGTRVRGYEGTRVRGRHYRRILIPLYNVRFSRGLLNWEHQREPLDSDLPGMWLETFKSHQDTKPNGPNSGACGFWDRG